jgi:predicted aspartyl protease
MTFAQRGTPLLLALAVAALSACDKQKAAVETTSIATTTTTAATTTQAVPTTTESKPAGPPGVHLRVVSGDYGVFAFARVYIGGKGPFTFTVDTGASHSVLDYDLVRRLHLRTIGEPLTVTGITCRGQAARLRIRKWRVGPVRLPAAEIQTIDMPDPGGGVDGLLGSDILSTFGAISVDYRKERLVLGSSA